VAAASKLLRVGATSWCAVPCCAVSLQEASAARARLVCLRNRLAELRGLNADRQQRAAELQERVAETEVCPFVCIQLCGCVRALHARTVSPRIDSLDLH
jgi:hypothetical protein